MPPTSMTPSTPPTAAKKISSSRKIHPLRAYLRERNSRHVCGRSWLPKVHQFDGKELIYDENAYDRFLYTDEDVQYFDAHSQFLDYLMTIPHDDSMFYKWMEGIEEGDKQRDFWETTHPSINQELQKFRETYTTRIPEETELAETEFPCDEEDFFAAEAAAWGMGTKTSSPKIDVNVGWLKADLVEDACYGPRRFYVRRLDNTQTHSQFHHRFADYFQWCIRTPYNLYSQHKIGLAVIYDPDLDMFSSAIVMGEGHGRCLIVYEMETGKTVRVPRASVEVRLRALRPQMMKHLQMPTSIPVELIDPVSPSEWDDFVNELKEVKQLYVTAIDGYSIKVTRYQPLGSPEAMAESFCRNLYCMGKCSVAKKWRSAPHQQIETMLPGAVESDCVTQPERGFSEEPAALDETISVCRGRQEEREGRQLVALDSGSHPPQVIF